MVAVFGSLILIGCGVVIATTPRSEETKNKSDN